MPGRNKQTFGVAASSVSDRTEAASSEQGIRDALLGLFPRLQKIDHAELMAGLAQGGRIRQAVVVALNDSDETPHFLFLMCSWRATYSVFITQQPREPRNFKNLNTLQRLLRRDYKYRGWISLRFSEEELSGKEKQSASE